MEKGPEITFRQQNPSITLIIASVGLVALALVIVITHFLRWKTVVPIGAILFIVPFFLALNFRHFFVSIKIGHEGVEYLSLFKRIKMDWVIICAYGVYYQSRYSISLEEEGASYTKTVGQRKVFVSAIPGYNPAQDERKIIPGVILFDYREKAMEVLKHYMAKPKSDWMKNYPPYQGF